MERLEHDKNYKPSDIAKICDVGVNAVQKWLIAGKIPSSKTPGGHYRVRGEDLAGFLKSLNISIPGISSATDRKLILIVEDDAPTRRFIRRLIEKEFPEFEIHEALDGYEAGFKTKALKPSLLVLDLLLPCLNGIRVCRMIRADGNFKDTRILAITGYKQERMRKIILRAGADDFLAKPFKVDEFIDSLKRLIPKAESSKI